MNQNESLLPLKIAVLTVSDTRTEADDKSGKILADNLPTAGHFLVEKTIVPESKVLPSRLLSEVKRSIDLRSLHAEGNLSVRFLTMRKPHQRSHRIFHSRVKDSLRAFSL